MDLMSSAIKVVGNISAGQHQQHMANQQAAIEIHEGNELAAAKQRDAARALKYRDRVMSRAKAVAASSGAGADDPTVNDLMDDLYSEGTLNALNALYEGDSAIVNSRYTGSMLKKSGKAAARQGILRATGNILDGASSLYKKYGGGGV